MQNEAKRISYLFKDKSKKFSFPNSLSSVHSVVPLSALRLVKPSLGVCSSQELEFIGLAWFGTSLIDSENMRFCSGSI